MMSTGQLARTSNSGPSTVAPVSFFIRPSAKTVTYKLIPARNGMPSARAAIMIAGGMAYLPGLFFIPRRTDAVVGGLFGYLDVVGVALGQAGGRYANELRRLPQRLHVLGAAVAHAGA